MEIARQAAKIYLPKDLPPAGRSSQGKELALRLSKAALRLTR